jgi:hypothetical protein
MTCMNNLPAASPTQLLPTLTPMTTQTRALNQDLWQLLTKAEPLTAEEWALVEEFERKG